MPRTIVASQYLMILSPNIPTAIDIFLIAELVEGEGVGADGDGFARAELRHADANARHRVVRNLVRRTGHGDFFLRTFQECVELRFVFEVERKL